MEIAFLDAEFVFSAAFLITIVVVILLQVYSFLAVQDSSITVIVCLSVGLSVGRSEPTNNQSLQSIKEA